MDMKFSLNRDHKFRCGIETRRYRFEKKRRKIMMTIINNSWRVLNLFSASPNCFAVERGARSVICVSDVIFLWKAEAKCDYDRRGHEQGWANYNKTRECCYNTHVARHVSNRVLILYHCPPRDYHFISIHIYRIMLGWWYRRTALN